MSNCIFLFRKDIRLLDNTALIEASKNCDRVYAVFVTEFFKGNERNKQFYYSALKNLSLKIPIHITKSISEFINEVKADELYYNRLYFPYDGFSEEEICKKIQCNAFKDFVLVEPGELKRYKVFTPYYRKWTGFEKNFKEDYPIDNFVETGRKYDFLERYNDPEASEEYAIKKVKSFDYTNYGIKHTSGFSKFINYGLVSIRFVYDTIKSDEFRRQLSWRDFYIQLYEDLENINGLRHYKIKWNNDTYFLNLWKEGKTGYPIIDAGMRQLNNTGMIDNRLRLLVSYFLVKVLHTNWKEGENYFRDNLLDYDPVLNIANWHWVSAVGADTSPLRKFNIVAQGKRYDPDGSFIRKWVNELSDVPDAFIHELWKMSDSMKVKYCGNYLPPIVDADVAYEEFRNEILKNLNGK